MPEMIGFGKFDAHIAYLNRKLHVDLTNFHWNHVHVLKNDALNRQCTKIGPADFTL